MIEIRDSMIKRFFVALTLIITASVTIATPMTAQALSGSGFQAGRIIDDGLFYNSSGLSLAEIQNFLNAKVPSCDTNGQLMRGSVTRAEYGTSVGVPPPYTCLKDYRMDTTAKGTEAGLCNGYPALNQSAAEIIYNVAQSCSISSRVLLVLLQKEQSLITDDWPWPVQYRSATGYGCPDTAPCDAQYYGFFNQVYNAARQFKNYRLNAASFNFIAGRNNTVGYNPNAGCDSSSVFIQNNATAGLYNYTPYQPNAAALSNLYGSGDSCSAYGNRNFWRMYNDWFGSTILPTVFKGSTQAAVYVLINGYKVVIPSMAILQDYGFDPNAITTIPQSQADSTAVPPADSGLSATLGSVIKTPSDTDADGGSVYLVSVGRKHPVTSMDQFNSFGFSTSNISYLPLNFLTALPSSPALSNYLSTPTSNAFQVSGGKKRIILDGATYNSLNSGGTSTLVSHYTVESIPSGTPISSGPILISNTRGGVSLYTNNDYYGLPSLDVLECWGLQSTLNYPLYKLAYDNYVGGGTSTVPLTCAVNVDASTMLVLNKTNKVSVPTGYGLSAAIVNADLAAIVNQLPTRSAPLGQVVKSADNPPIWYIESGARKSIPSMKDFELLKLSLAQTDTIARGAANALPASGIKHGIGQVVKANETGTVYVITSATARTAIASGDDLMAHKYSWNTIIQSPSAILDILYPAADGKTISKYLYDQRTDKVYLMDANNCFAMDATYLTSYGQSKSTVQTNQTYLSSIFPYINLDVCKPPSVYAKSNTQGTVYWIDAGKKHAFSSWSQLEAHSGTQSPNIITLTDSTLATLTTAAMP